MKIQIKWSNTLRYVLMLFTVTTLFIGCSKDKDDPKPTTNQTDDTGNKNDDKVTDPFASFILDGSTLNFTIHHTNEQLEGIFINYYNEENYSFSIRVSPGMEVGEYQLAANSNFIMRYQTLEQNLYNPTRGTIKILEIDYISGEIRLEFDATLINQAGESIQIKDGKAYSDKYQ